MLKLHVVTEVELPEDLGSFQVIEKKVQEAAFQSGLEMMEKIFEQFERVYFEGKPGVWKKDLREKWFQTSVGEIRKQRWRVWDPREKRHRYPLDEWQGLKPRERQTPGFRRICIEKVIRKPYRTSNQEIYELTGVRQTTMALWRLTQKTARASRQKEPTIPDWRLKPIPQLDPRMKVDPCPILAIDPDATYCHNQDKEAKDHEIKAAVFYTGKEPTNQNQTQWRLTGKHILTSRTGETLEDFFNRVTYTAMSHYGAHAQTQIIIHGDGDPWIKRLKSEYWDQALIRLDPWHAVKRIREATSLRQIRKDWVKWLYREPERLIGRLQIWKLQKTAPGSEIRKRMNEVIQYLKNNLEGLLPSGIPKEIKKQYPRMFLRGSGPIESNIGSHIADRFKQRRMSWSAHGKDNLLYLREKLLNEPPKKKYSVPQPLTRKAA